MLMVFAITSLDPPHYSLVKAEIIIMPGDKQETWLMPLLKELRSSNSFKPHTLSGGCYCCLHFMEQESEVQRGEVTF
jgi:hypothetical protein